MGLPPPNAHSSTNSVTSDGDSTGFKPHIEDVEVKAFVEMSMASLHRLLQSVRTTSEKTDSVANTSDATNGTENQIGSCVRCHADYWKNGKKQLCRFHAGPKQAGLLGKDSPACCPGSNWSTTNGCRVEDFHLSSTLGGSQFTATPKANGQGDFRSKKVYAIDVEFVYTSSGMEAARVSLVDTKGNTVLDEYVLPENPIVDFNSRFSGIYPESMRTAISHQQMMNEIFNFVNEDTLLIGHALESDFKALRITHLNVIDTSILFECVDASGLYRKKQSLKELAHVYLGKTIQQNVTGHCSVEDAYTCIQLVAAFLYTKRCMYDD